MPAMLDRLLDNWDAFTCNYRDPDKLRDRIGPFKWSGIRSLLRQAVAFDVENVEEFIQQAKGGHLTEQDYPNVMPVAPVMWLEWTNRSQMDTDGKRLTFAVSGETASFNSDLACGTLLYSWGTDETGGVQNLIFAFVQGQDGTFLFCGTYGFRCDPDGKPLAVKALTTMVRALETTDPDRFRGTMRCWFGTPFMALSFMHCKNVTTKRRETPKRKVSAAASGKRKAPYVKQYTLLIEPMKQVLRTEGQIETTGIKQALHICRGHFKDYNKGKGLFGKVKGLFWWDMHTRGSAEVGVVLKDYKVDAPVH